VDPDWLFAGAALRAGELGFYEQTVLETHGAAHTMVRLADASGARDRLRITDVVTPTTFELRSGDDLVEVRDRLSQIAAALTLDGGAGDDRLLLLDGESDSPRQTGSLEGDRITGLGMAPGAFVAHAGFEGLGDDAALTLQLLNDDGYDLTVLDTLVSVAVLLSTGPDSVLVAGFSAPLLVDLGGADDSLTIRGGAGALTARGSAGVDTLTLAPIASAAQPWEIRDSADGQGVVLCADPALQVDFAAVEELLLDLPEGADQVVLSFSFAEPEVLIRGNGGNDQALVYRVGSPTTVSSWRFPAIRLPSCTRAWRRGCAWSSRSSSSTTP
jgi:hypothetical protein